MPHNGPRTSPVADRRNACLPLFKMAAPTMLPAGIVTETPLTTSVTVSGMRKLLRHSRRQIRRNGNRGLAIHDLRYEKFSRPGRRRDAEAFVSRRQIESPVLGMWSDQRKLVRSRSPKPGPRPQRRELAQRRQILNRAIEHARYDLRIYVRVVDAKLSRRTNQQLPGLARLNVECNGLRRERMGALQ